MDDECVDIALDDAVVIPFDTILLKRGQEWHIDKGSVGIVCSFPSPGNVTVYLRAWKEVENLAGETIISTRQGTRRFQLHEVQPFIKGFLRGVVR